MGREVMLTKMKISDLQYILPLVEEVGLFEFCKQTYVILNMNNQIIILPTKYELDSNEKAGYYRFDKFNVMVVGGKPKKYLITTIKDNLIKKGRKQIIEKLVDLLW